MRTAVYHHSRSLSFCCLLILSLTWPSRNGNAQSALHDSYLEQSRTAPSNASWAWECFNGEPEVLGPPLVWKGNGQPLPLLGSIPGFLITSDPANLANHWLTITASGTAPARELTCEWDPASIVGDAPGGFNINLPQYGYPQNRWVYLQFKVRFHSPDVWPTAPGTSENIATRPATFLLPDGQGIGWDNLKVYPRLLEDPAGGKHGRPMPAAGLMARFKDSKDGAFPLNWWSWTVASRSGAVFPLNGQYHPGLSPMPRAALSLNALGDVTAPAITESEWITVTMRFDLNSFIPASGSAASGEANSGDLWINGQKVPLITTAGFFAPGNPFGFSLRALTTVEACHPNLWVAPGATTPAFRNAAGPLTVLPKVTFSWRGCASGDMDLDEFYIGWRNLVILDLNNNGVVDNPNPGDHPPLPRQSFGSATTFVRALSTYSESITDLDLDSLPDWWETHHFGQTGNCDANGNPDQDDYSNLQEWRHNTHPNDVTHLDRDPAADKDFDGMLDVWERQHWPANRPITTILPFVDEDHDGLTNLTEFRYQLNPLVDNLTTDADGDRFNDAWEVYHGFYNRAGQPVALSDDDGDGITLTTEYDDGTDPNRYDWPTDPAALAALFSPRPAPNLLPNDGHNFTRVESPRTGGGTNIFLRWRTAPGVRYLVEFNDSATPGQTWQVLDEVEGEDERTINWFVGTKGAITQPTQQYSAPAPSGLPATFTVLRVYPTFPSDQGEVGAASDGRLLCWTPRGSEVPCNVWIPGNAVWPGDSPAAGQPVLEPLPSTFAYPPLGTCTWQRSQPAHQVTLIGHYYGAQPVTSNYQAFDFRLQSEEIKNALREIGNQWQELWTLTVVVESPDAPSGTTNPGINLTNVINLGYLSGGGLAATGSYFFRLRLQFLDLDQDGEFDYLENRAGAIATGTTPVTLGNASPAPRPPGFGWLPENRLGTSGSPPAAPITAPPDDDDWDGDHVPNWDDAVPYEKALTFAPVPESNYVAVPLTFPGGTPLPGVPVAINDRGSVLIAPELPPNKSITSLTQAEREFRILYLWTASEVFEIKLPETPSGYEILGWDAPGSNNTDTSVDSVFSLHRDEDVVLAHVVMRRLALPNSEDPEDISDRERTARHAFGSGRFAVTWKGSFTDANGTVHPPQLKSALVKYDTQTIADPSVEIPDAIPHPQLNPSAGHLQASRWFAGGSLLGREFLRYQHRRPPNQLTEDITRETYHFFHCLPPHTPSSGGGSPRGNPFETYLPRLTGDDWDTCAYKWEYTLNGASDTLQRHLWNLPNRTASHATFGGYFLASSFRIPPPAAGGNPASSSYPPDIEAPAGPYSPYVFLRDPMHVTAPLVPDHTVERELIGSGSYLGNNRILPTALNDMPFGLPPQTMTVLPPPGTTSPPPNPAPPAYYPPYSTGPLITGSKPAPTGLHLQQDNTVYLWPGSPAPAWEPLKLLADSIPDPEHPNLTKPVYLRGRATAVNDRGEIIGTSGANLDLSWIWRNGRSHTLKDLIQPDPSYPLPFHRFTPAAINNTGTIAASALSASTGLEWPTILVPVVMDIVTDEELLVEAGGPGLDVDAIVESDDEGFLGGTVAFSVSRQSSLGGALEPSDTQDVDIEEPAATTTFTPSTVAGSTYEVEARLKSFTYDAPGPQQPTSRPAGLLVKTEKITVAPGRASTVVITITGSTGPGTDYHVAADGKSRREITALLTDKFGNIVAEGTPVAWAVAEGGGQITPIDHETNSEGKAKAILTAGKIPVPTRVTLNTDSVSHYIVFDQFQINLTLTAGALAVGQQSIKHFPVTASVNVPDGTPIVWQTSRGSIAGDATVTNGTAHANVQVPLSEQGRLVVVKAGVAGTPAVTSKFVPLDGVPSNGGSGDGEYLALVHAPSRHGQEVVVKFAGDPVAGTLVFLSNSPAVPRSLPLSVPLNSRGYHVCKISLPPGYMPDSRLAFNVFLPDGIQSVPDGKVLFLQASDFNAVTALPEPQPAGGAPPGTWGDPLAGLSEKAVAVAGMSAALHTSAIYSNQPGGQMPLAEAAESTRAAFIGAAAVVDNGQTQSNASLAPPAFGGGITHQAQCNVLLLQMAGKMDAICSDAAAVAKRMDQIDTQNSIGSSVGRLWNQIALGGKVWDVLKAGSNGLQQAFGEEISPYVNELKRIGDEALLTLIRTVKAGATCEELRIIAKHCGVLPLIDDIQALVRDLEPEAVLALFHALARFAVSFAEHPGATAIATISHIDPWLSQKLNGWAHAADSEDHRKVIVAAAGLFAGFVQNATILAATAGELANDPNKTFRRLAGDMVGTVISASLGSEDAKRELGEMVPFYSWLLLGEKVFIKWEAGLYYEAGKEAWALLVQAIGDVTMVIPIVKGGSAALRIIGSKLEASLLQTVRKKPGKFLRESKGIIHDEVTKRIQECRALGEAFCFPPGTPVLMADGTTKPIESIHRGDLILADDPADDYPPAPREVANQTSGESEYLVSVSFDSDGDGISDGTVESTPNHPIWTTLAGWTSAQHLQQGDTLICASGATVEVVSLQSLKYDGPTKNLSIAGEHGYFVVIQGTAILVHNTNPGSRSGLVYEVPVIDADITKVRRKRNAAASDGPSLTLTEIKAIIGNTGDFRYTGRGSVPGIIHDPEIIFKRRYSKTKQLFKRWVNIPGTPMRAFVTVKLKNIKLHEIVHTHGTTSDFYKYNGQNVIGSNGRPYTNLEAYLRAKEWHIESIFREAGLSVNLNQPLNRNPRAEMLKAARELPPCNR